jgi:hypothetical protein
MPKFLVTGGVLDLTPLEPATPGNPPGIWGGSNQPFPTPPIANVPGAPGYQPPGNPPGIWGGSNEPFPTPPIVIPPQKPGDPPLVIWGGSNQPFPTPPIYLPGGGNPPPGGDRVQLMEWHTGWSEATGWVVIGTPKFEHPAPAKK